MYSTLAGPHTTRGRGPADAALPLTRPLRYLLHRRIRRQSQGETCWEGRNPGAVDHCHLDDAILHPRSREGSGTAEGSCRTISTGGCDRHARAAEAVEHDAPMIAGDAAVHRVGLQARPICTDEYRVHVSVEGV